MGGFYAAVLTAATSAENFQLYVDNDNITREDTPTWSMLSVSTLHRASLIEGSLP